MNLTELYSLPDLRLPAIAGKAPCCGTGGC